MTWMREIAALRRELKDWVEVKLSGIAVWTQTANASALGGEDAVTTGDDDPKNGQRPVRRVEPFGFRSRPPAKQRCLSLRIGTSTVVYLGVASDGGYGPNDLDDGESVVYGTNVEKALHARKDGTVALNGDDYSLPKTEDLLTALAGLAQALATVLSAATDSGIVAAMAVPPAPPILNPSTGIPYATNSAAIAGLLASATPYKSTKVKSG